jgi:hypothetical protein
MGCKLERKPPGPTFQEEILIDGLGCGSGLEVGAMGEGGLRSALIGGAVRATVVAFWRGGVGGGGGLREGVWVVVLLVGGGFRKVVFSEVRSRRVTRSWSSEWGSVVYSGLGP